VAWTLLAVLIVACGSGAAPEPPAADDRTDDQEERLTSAEEVPEAVRVRATEITHILGPEVHCEEWYWDEEDTVWECRVVGHPRIVELDVTPEVEFSEMEFEMQLSEIRQFAGPVAELIESTCGDTEHTVIEVSIRNEDLITPDPRFEELWGEPEVFIEVQCPDGEDFEVDAYGTLVTTPDDDVDPENENGE
jgi:hypothetical protein